MVTSVVIIILSLAMFVYWFRYSCVLILGSNWNEDQAQAVARRNELSFGSVNESLTRADSPQALDRVRDMLDADLKRVLALLANCPGVLETGQSLECKMLMLDFWLMKSWYALTRTTAGPRAHRALREMAQVVGYIAGECSDQLAPAQN